MDNSAVTWLARPEWRKAFLLAAIIAVIAVALLDRTYFLIDRGGLALDQRALALQNHFGGITNHYLSMRDAILAWKAEAKPWPYLPGYPLFLAILHIIGIKDLSLVRFAQAIIDSLAILPLYFVLIRLAKSAYLAIFGCLIYAAAPWWSTGSTYLLSESLLPALVILLLAGMLFVRERADGYLNWFLLGLLAAILPFFRSEMILLCGPLVVWALLVAPKDKRISSAAWVMVGFAVPLLLWAGRNYYIHGRLMLTPPAKWYVAWAGLGQIANNYGYFVSDDRAAKLLASKGIQYHSLEAEKYWFKEYLGAWINHPGHVIRTIFFRLTKILGRVEHGGLSVSGLVLKLYGAMAFITPVVLIWLLRKRRTADAFFVAWPMAYALASLGVLYVESRYVRYAGLTYLLVLSIILGRGADVLRQTWPSHWGFAEPRRIVAVISVMGFLTLGAATAFQLNRISDVARGREMIDRLNVNTTLEPTLSLKDIAFRPAVSTVETSHGEAGLELRANAPVGRYLLTAPIPARINGGMILRYRATLKQGAVGFGVLSADATRWLSHHTVSRESATEIEGAFASAVEPGSQFVVNAAGTKSGTDVLISRLELTLACPKPVNPLDLLLNKAMIEPYPCP